MLQPGEAARRGGHDASHTSLHCFHLEQPPKREHDCPRSSSAVVPAAIPLSVGEAVLSMLKERLCESLAIGVRQTSVTAKDPLRQESSMLTHDTHTPGVEVQQCSKVEPSLFQGLQSSKGDSADYIQC